MSSIGSYNKKIKMKDTIKSNLIAIFYVSLFLGLCFGFVFGIHYLFEISYLDVIKICIGIGIIDAIRGINKK